jgi:hypothetical protein
MAADNLDDLHHPPFDCDCGRGARVTQADGAETCTRTLALFREAHRSIPAQWLPLRRTSLAALGEQGK